MRSLTLTRSFYKNPQNGFIFLLVVVLFCEIISWATSPQMRWNNYTNYYNLAAYIKNFVVGLLAPELCTLYILLFLIDSFHRFLGIRQVKFNIKSILRYEVTFLPLFLISFFFFFPITLHVRFLLREFPNYSFNRYLDLYIFNGFTIQTYLFYLPFVVILGYILINVSLVRDFIESNTQVRSSPGASAGGDYILPDIKLKETTPEYPQSQPGPTDHYLRFIEAKTGAGEIFLKVEECYFFETVEERYYAEHPKGRFRIAKPLSVLEEELEPLHFFRGHRSFIINLNYLDSYSYWEKGKYILYVKTSTEMRELIMSRNRFTALRDALTANRKQPALR
ncbi:MAG: LytTR family DNA-binding domain-containing protein [Spirosomataceae bacterium]